MVSVLIHFSDQEKAIVFKKRLQKKYDKAKAFLKRDYNNYVGFCEAYKKWMY